MIRATSLQQWTLAPTTRQWALVVALLAGAYAAAYSLRGATSWFWFERGVPLLFDPDTAVGGLHLYAAHPELQIGPATFLVAGPFVIAGAAGTLLASAVMLGCGAAIAALIADLMPRDARSIAAFRIAVLLAAPAWVELSVSVAHLDDALALLLTTSGLWAVRRDRPCFAAAALALAVDCKPWALGFAAIILVAARGRRLRAVAIYAAVVTAAWLPFVLADRHTLDALRFHIDVSASSVLRVVGVDAAVTPSWCRTVQLVAGLCLAALVAWRRQPAAVPLVVVGVRMIFDPATHIYFDAGLVVASTCFDVLVSRRRFPWFTAGAMLLLFVPGYVVLAVPASALSLGVVRGVFLTGAVVAAVASTRAPGTSALARRPGARQRAAAARSSAA